MPLLSSNIAGSASRSPSWGAWIEIATSGMVNGAKAYSRSPSWGAWIEIMHAPRIIRIWGASLPLVGSVD